MAYLARVLGRVPLPLRSTLSRESDEFSSALAPPSERVDPKASNPRYSLARRFVPKCAPLKKAGTSIAPTS